MDSEKIGRYTIVGKIGQGGMGEVYKAHDPVLNRDVAVKTMSASVTGDAGLRKRFLREAQSAAHLNHSNIVTVYELGEDRDKTFIAMELLEGQDLKRLIGGPQLARLEDKLGLMEQICDGVAHAHSKDIVHRDLKPANIHIQPSGHVKIMDFGLARFGHSDMTRTGVIMGTPNYMAPEQVRGERVDVRSDVFSLGAVFYEVLTGRKAFEAETTHAVLFRVLDGEPDPVRERNPDTPPILSAVVEKALAKDPARRFQNAAEMREALQVVRKVVEGEMSEAEGLAHLQIDAQATVMYPAASEDTVLEGPQRGTRGGARKTLPPQTIRPGVGERTLDAPSPTTMRPGAGGRSVSRPVTKPSAPRPAARSPWRVPALLAVVVVAVVITVVWPRLGPKAPPPPASEVGQEQIGALTEAVVASQIELGRQSFKDKNYKEAAARARSALQMDPKNSEASQMLERAEGSLRELEDAAQDARKSFDSGDTERASRALAKVMAIDPNHPVADQLAAKLNRHFQGQAVEARKTMEEARAGAQGARAGTRPPFTEAQGHAREAEALFAKGEFAVATRKFLDARDGFERARRAAEAPPPTIPQQPVPSVLPPSTLQGSQSPLPQPTLPQPPLPTGAPATVAPPPTLPGEEPAVRRVLEEYARAIQAKDVAAFKRVKPNLSPEEEKRFREIFKAIKSYQVSLAVESVQIDGSAARVRVSRRDVIDGSPVNFQQSIVLTRGPGGWSIQEIGK